MSSSSKLMRRSCSAARSRWRRSRTHTSSSGSGNSSSSRSSAAACAAGRFWRSPAGRTAQPARWSARRAPTARRASSTRCARPGCGGCVPRCHGRTGPSRRGTAPFDPPAAPVRSSTPGTRGPGRSPRRHGRVPAARRCSRTGRGWKVCRTVSGRAVSWVGWSSPTARVGGRRCGLRCRRDGRSVSRRCHNSIAPPACNTPRAPTNAYGRARSHS